MQWGALISNIHLRFPGFVNRCGRSGRDFLLLCWGTNAVVFSRLFACWKKTGKCVRFRFIGQQVGVRGSSGRIEHHWAGVIGSSRG